MDLACKTFLENLFDTKIKNESLFEMALTHTSFAKDNNTNVHYERLEFLGDAVLKLCASDILYNMYPDYSEGQLSKIRSIVVSDNTLSEIVDKFGLEKYIILGRQEDKMGGRKKSSIKACMFEALLGAFYLEGNFAKVEKFLKDNLTELIKLVDDNFVMYNSKEVLQEFTQGLTKTRPEYKVIKEEGPSHEKIFTVEVSYQDKVIAQGCGRTKREAEKVAAYEAYRILTEK